MLTRKRKSEAAAATDGDPVPAPEQEKEPPAEEAPAEAPAAPTTTNVPSELRLTHGVVCVHCSSTKTLYGFTSATGQYSCHKCCVLNQQNNQFYGPAGTKNLDEAGGRNCAECGAAKSSRWRSHKEKLGCYVCETCRSHFKKNGTYTRANTPRAAPSAGAATRKRGRRKQSRESEEEEEAAAMAAAAEAEVPELVVDAGAAAGAAAAEEEAHKPAEEAAV